MLAATPAAARRRPHRLADRRRRRVRGRARSPSARPQGIFHPYYVSAAGAVHRRAGRRGRGAARRPRPRRAGARAGRGGRRHGDRAGRARRRCPASSSVVGPVMAARGGARRGRRSRSPTPRGCAGRRSASRSRRCCWRRRPGRCRRSATRRAGRSPRAAPRPRRAGGTGRRRLRWRRRAAASGRRAAAACSAATRADGGGRLRRRRNGGGTIAVSSQSSAAGAALSTGVDVAALGGFSGRESEVSAAWLAERVADGDIRWVLADGESGGMPKDGRTGATDVMAAVAGDVHAGRRGRRAVRLLRSRPRALAVRGVRRPPWCASGGPDAPSSTVAPMRRALLALAVRRRRAPPAGHARTVWLCKPGLSDNPCAGRLDTARFSPAAGALGRDAPARRARRRVDCFYVYPTVSDQKTPSATRARRPRAALDRALAGRALRRHVPRLRARLPPGHARRARRRRPQADRQRAYRDVRAAWRDYLRHHNHGRGVVLIGHSQGTFHLRELLAEEIEPRREAPPPARLRAPARRQRHGRAGPRHGRRLPPRPRMPRGRRRPAASSRSRATTARSRPTRCSAARWTRRAGAVHEPRGARRRARPDRRSHPARAVRARDRDRGR